MVHVRRALAAEDPPFQDHHDMFENDVEAKHLPGVPSLSLCQLEALKRAGVKPGGILAIQVAMTQIKAGSAVAEVNQVWIGRHSGGQHRNTVGRAFKQAADAGLIIKVKDEDPERRQSAHWDFTPLLRLHGEAEAKRQRTEPP